MLDKLATTITINEKIFVNIFFIFNLLRFLGRKSWKLWLFGKRIIRKCFKKV